MYNADFAGFGKKMKKASVRIAPAEAFFRPKRKFYSKALKSPPQIPRWFP